jgi:uncharacterized protein
MRPIPNINGAAVVISAALALFGANAASAQTFNLTAAGLGPTGVMATINSGVAAAVQAAFPGSTITYQPGQGGFANILLVDQKRVPLGYAVDAEIAMGLAGHDPFKKPVNSIRIIANLAGDVPMHVAFARDVAEKYNLKEFSDIAKNKAPLRMITNTRGNVVSYIAEAMLAELGVKPEDVRRWGGELLYIPGQEMPKVFADRRADGILNMVNVGGASVISMARSRPMVMLPIDKGIIQRVTKQFGLTR